jgi:hypothetical protein
MLVEHSRATPLSKIAALLAMNSLKTSIQADRPALRTAACFWA